MKTGIFVLDGKIVAAGGGNALALEAGVDDSVFSKNEIILMRDAPL
jgi:hypothetical protein